MVVKCWGILFLWGMSLFGASYSLNHTPKKSLIIIKQTHLLKPSYRTGKLSNYQIKRTNKIDKLKKRIIWLEELNKYVYHKSGKSKIFPYEKKLKYLKIHLKEIQNSKNYLRPTSL